MARALNKLVLGQADVKLAPPLDQSLTRVNELLICNGLVDAPSSSSADSEASDGVLVKFEPRQCLPQDFAPVSEHVAPHRIQAAKAGSCHICPCPCEKCADALEVRFVDPALSIPQIKLFQDICVDCGTDECLACPRHAAALGETDQLAPDVLAEVDLQMFWVAVLRIDSSIGILQELPGVDNNLIGQWEELEMGVNMNQQHVASLVRERHLTRLSSVDSEQVFQIQDKTHHERLALDHACFGLMLTLDGVEPFVDASRPIPDAQFCNFCQMTELQALIMPFATAGKMEQQRPFIQQECTNALLSRFASEGFKVDPEACDQTASCGNCGESDPSKLKFCGGCGGVAHCGTECQHVSWRDHKRECDGATALVRGIVNDLVAARDPDSPTPGGPNIVVGKSSHGSGLPTQAGMFGEVSGVGTSSIFWNPGSISCMMTSPDDLSGMAVSFENEIEFTDRLELPPVLHFALSCGPLSDIELAKQTLSEALQQVDGDATQLKVNGAEFTALERAAKKGNKDMVKWLCTNKHTKSLVHVSSPIGWASCAGQTEVVHLLLSHGADLSATNCVMWGNTPPLLVAAQNGQLEAMKLLVDECDIDIHIRDASGRGVIESICDSPVWRDIEGHVASYNWAMERLA